jgi:septal ring factor EnvC (AmiA/AmiB activator)
MGNKTWAQWRRNGPQKAPNYSIPLEENSRSLRFRITRAKGILSLAKIALVWDLSLCYFATIRQPLNMEPTDYPASENLTSAEIDAAATNVKEEPTPFEATGQSLQEAEELLRHIKERFTQVQAAQAQQTELEGRLSELNTEIEFIKSQLAATWEELESQLITWRDKEELFWQFLRFSGIGFALAMLLNHFIK